MGRTLATITIADWMVLIPVIGGQIVLIIQAIRNSGKISAVHNEVRPPSNGRTLGALVEGQAVKQSMVAQDYVERVKATKEGAPPPPPPVIPFSLTPTIDDPGLLNRVNEGIKNAQQT